MLKGTDNLARVTKERHLVSYDAQLGMLTILARGQIFARDLSCGWIISRCRGEWYRRTPTYKCYRPGDHRSTIAVARIKSRKKSDKTSI